MDLMISSILFSQLSSNSMLGIVTIAANPCTKAHIAIILSCITFSGSFTFLKTDAAVFCNIANGGFSSISVSSRDNFMLIFYVKIKNHSKTDFDKKTLHMSFQV